MRDNPYLEDDGNPEQCGVAGRLSDADVIKLQNLAMTSTPIGWEVQNRECGLPEGHSGDVHISRVAFQEFRDTAVHWWASWTDADGLRDEAALFTGPMCDKKFWDDPESAPDSYGECMLLAGHTGPLDSDVDPDDRKHHMVF